jgi:D-alanyl-D-alanine carboxypeptidase
MVKFTQKFLLAAVIGITITAQSLPDKLQDKLESLQKEKSLFGISAAVMLGDQLIWSGTAGYSNPTTHDTVTVEMNGSIGSNTKMMTSSIILQLVEEGKLSLDDTIDKWITPSYKINGEITVRQLLNHTSGIADYTTEAWVDSFRTNPSKVWTVEELIDAFVGAPNFEPGSSWKYSNTGFLLLGEIIEQIENKTYREILYERIINPLQLNTMYTPIEDEPTGPVMTPWFDIDDDGEQDNLEEYSLMAMHTSGGAAGYVYSTPAHLAMFLNKLFSEEVINQSSLEEMITPVPARSTYDYGLGLVKYKIFDKPYYGHTGQYMGYLSFSAYEPESQLSVAIIMNLTFADIYGVGQEITELAYNEIITSTEKENLLNEFLLSQNYPNPFNPSTKINYTIPTVETPYKTSLQTKLIVYDILGREVATLVNAELQPGKYEAQFNAINISSGVYFYKLSHGDFFQTKKMLLVK